MQLASHLPPLPRLLLPRPTRRQWRLLNSAVRRVWQQEHPASLEGRGYRSRSCRRSQQAMAAKGAGGGGSSRAIASGGGGSGIAEAEERRAGPGREANSRSATAPHASGLTIAAEGFPPLAPRVRCAVEFRNDGVIISFSPKQECAAAGIPLSEVGFIRIAGRGRIRTVTPGIIPTSRTTIETTIHLNAGARELMMVTSDVTPEELQVKLPQFRPPGRTTRRRDSPSQISGEAAARFDEGYSARESPPPARL